MTPLFACLASVAAHLAAEFYEQRIAAGAAKVVASSCFLWAALSWGALESRYGCVVTIGLALCWLGDALLIPRGQGRSFQLGIAAFLLGHVAYSVAFAGNGVDLVWLAGAALGVGGAALLTVRWLAPNVPEDFRIPVYAYLAVISLMLVTALSAASTGATPWLWIGAVGFAASDLSVARERFVRADFANSAWGLPLYFCSQLALAWSAGGSSSGAA